MIPIVSILKKVWGFVADHWKIIGLLLLIIFTIAFFTRACSTPAKFDEEQLRRNQEAIASGERARMEAEAVRTKAAEAQIDTNRADADNKHLKAVSDAKKEVKGMTDEELKAFLEGR